MRVRFLIGLLAASIPVVAGASSALAQREDERYLHLEQMRPPASPRPRPRSEEPPPRAAPQAGQQAPSGFFGGSLFGFRRPDPPPVAPAATPPPVEARRPITPDAGEPYGRRAYPERAYREPAERPHREPVERAVHDPGERTFERRRVVARPAPAVRAPRAVVEKPKAVEPTTHVVVFGDSLAEALRDGLHEAYEDAVEIDVVNRTRGDSGLVRTDHYDWAKAIGDYLSTNPKITSAVVMLGINDRQPIREGDVSHDPLSDRWREIYRDRVDALVRIFSERRIPLIWVGTPPVKNEKSSAELVALNDIYRDRVQRAGGTYVDIWPGFVDDENRYAAVGPDTGGQTARLRMNDGVHFTDAGARKVAFFVETELKRLLGRKDGSAVATVPAATGGGEAGSQPGAAQPGAGAGTDAIDRIITASLPALPEPPGVIPLAARPAAGPVVPLTRPDTSPGGTLLGARPRFDGDAAFLVDQALRNGVAPIPRPGRADDFSWPPS
jgi:hypothetical protein